MFVVGPDSASSHPGPASYGKQGPLTVTDANLLLGRLHIDSFPKIFGPTEDQPLDYNIVKEKFDALTKEINESGTSYTAFEVAQGFLAVANENMCVFLVFRLAFSFLFVLDADLFLFSISRAKPIRQLTEAKGFLTTSVPSFLCPTLSN